MADLLTEISARSVKPKFTDVQAGDTVRVYTKVREGEKTRTQFVEGLVIRRRGGVGPSANFTVRLLASGVGVERTFPIHSPLVEKITVRRAAKVRRAKLYYMRGLTGKAARLTEKPVKTADRERQHPWAERYKLVTPEATPPPASAAAPSKKESKPEAKEEKAAPEPEKKAKTPEKPAGQAAAKGKKQTKAPAPQKEPKASSDKSK